MEATPAVRERVRNSLRAALIEAIQPYLGPGGEGPARPLRRTAKPRAAASDSSTLHLSAGQWRHVGRDVLALHEGYTQRTTPFAHEANPIHTRAAGYQFYFLPRNWYRVWRVLQELPWASGGADRGIDGGVDGGAGSAPTGVPTQWLVAAGTGGSDGSESGGAAADTLYLLDLGCGSGAYSLAWLAWLAERRATGADRVPAAAPLHVHLTLVDQGHELLGLAQANLSAFARRALPGVTLHCETHADGVQAFLAAPSPHSYAVAGAAMTLNELALLGPRRVSARAEALSGTLRRLVRPGGGILFVEPGTRRGYMNLMTLRENLVALPILYPCPHNVACPMWDGAVRHWCHATEQLPLGFFFDAELRRRAGVAFDMRDVGLAALAVQALPGSLPGAPFQPRSGERIVSAPLRPRPPGGRGNPKGAHRSSPPTPATSAERVVLACAPDGRLHERPVPGAGPGGPYTRGRWREEGP